METKEELMRLSKKELVDKYLISSTLVEDYMHKQIDLEGEIDDLELKLNAINKNVNIRDYRVLWKALELSVKFINQHTKYYCGDKYFVDQARAIIKTEEE